MFTKEVRPVKIYRVIFENMVTGSLDWILIEATSSEEASSWVLAKLGNDYDLIKCMSVKTKDLN